MLVNCWGMRGIKHFGACSYWTIINLGLVTYYTTQSLIIFLKQHMLFYFIPYKFLPVPQFQC